jgi:hypothetical protein
MRASSLSQHQERTGVCAGRGQGRGRGGGGHLQEPRGCIARLAHHPGLRLLVDACHAVVHVGGQQAAVHKQGGPHLQHRGVLREEATAQRPARVQRGVPGRVVVLVQRVAGWGPRQPRGRHLGRRVAGCAAAPRARRFGCRRRQRRRRGRARRRWAGWDAARRQAAAAQLAHAVAQQVPLQPRLHLRVGACRAPMEPHNRCVTAASDYPPPSP